MALPRCRPISLVIEICFWPRGTFFCKKSSPQTSKNTIHALDWSGFTSPKTIYMPRKFLKPQIITGKQYCILFRRRRIMSSGICILDTFKWSVGMIRILKCIWKIHFLRTCLQIVGIELRCKLHDHGMNKLHEIRAIYFHNETQKEPIKQMRRCLIIFLVRQEHNLSSQFTVACTKLHFHKNIQ